MWLVIPWYTPAIYGVLFLLALRRSLHRWNRLPVIPSSLLSRAGTAFVAALLLLALGVTAQILKGRQMPGQAVSLSFPLSEGTYLVVNGGSNELISAHHATLDGERFRRWRGQSYGVDIVRLGRLGLRASGILPADPARYEIFGEPLYAPCSGEVITAMDGSPEMSPPRMDRRNMEGNYVILQCRNAWIFMGHLQQGSVRARKGDQVILGQLIGRVGNTGNTSEPHLHIHAQQPGTTEAPLSGQPLHIRFGDRFPARNVRFLLKKSSL